MGTGSQKFLRWSVEVGFFQAVPPDARGRICSSNLVGHWRLLQLVIGRAASRRTTGPKQLVVVRLELEVWIPFLPRFEHLPLQISVVSRQPTQVLPLILLGSALICSLSPYLIAGSGVGVPLQALEAGFLRWCFSVTATPCCRGGGEICDFLLGASH
jgi:hypothetical protein